MRMRTLENMIVEWRGAGWYASRQEWGRIRWWFVGGDETNQPDVYRDGLGTPSWIDSPEELGEIE